MALCGFETSNQLHFPCYLLLHHISYNKVLKKGGKSAKSLSLASIGIFALFFNPDSLTHVLTPHCYMKDTAGASYHHHQN